MKSNFSLLEWSLLPEIEKAWKEISQQHYLVLDPFDPLYRARIFSIPDSAIIGDGPMTLSLRKARKFGFLALRIPINFNNMQELTRSKIIVPPGQSEILNLWYVAICSAYSICTVFNIAKGH